MQSDWLMGLLGGLVIGAAASMFLLVNGRIMGASGILGGIVDGSGRSNMAERIAFCAGLFLIPLLAKPAFPQLETHVTSNLVIVVAAGLLVGVGTRLANGCTSGHGVCGMSRFSLRGFAASIFYILGGGVTVLAFRHVLHLI